MMKQQRLTERLRERKVRRRRLRRRLVRLILLGLVLAVAAVAAVRIGGWPLGQLLVTGDKLIPIDEITRIAGIGQPVNVLSFSVAEVERRLSQDPRVEAVAVRREWPLTVRIELAERVPVGYLAIEYGYALLDSKGVVMAVSDSLRNVHLPVLTGIRGDWQYIGDRCDLPELVPVLRFLADLDDNSRLALAEVHLNENGRISALTVDSVPVRIGGSDRLPEKAQVLGQILQDLKKNGIKPEYIDIQYATPVIKLPAAAANSGKH
ncbi:MAG: FtsQ-type POTRA domain-containing protein [Negativicutes bacterium]|nr:FtsQ-type POTRA domain-containing protein [Negativicutes bacterium]